MRRLLIPLALVCALAGLGGALAAHWYFRSTGTRSAAVAVDLPPGSGVAAIAERLAAAGLIERPRTWAWLTRLSGRARRLKAGEYLIPPGATPVAIAEQITEGHILLHPLTLVEGWTLAEALRAARASEVLSHRLPVEDAEAARTLMRAVGAADLPAEGQFYPDTYLVARHSSDVELFQQAHARLCSVLAAAWSARAPDLALDSAQEALVLASIIEKESAVAEERPLISAVFQNRLRLGMRLQTDPTVIYGLGERYRGELSRADLATDTPYNTYTRAGLPPGPIALPGRESLRAALHPATTNALYFVALGDGSGRHAFSATLAAHEAAVARYLARLRHAPAAREHRP